MESLPTRPNGLRYSFGGSLNYLGVVMGFTENAVARYPAGQNWVYAGNELEDYGWLTFRVSRWRPRIERVETD